LSRSYYNDGTWVLNGYYDSGQPKSVSRGDAKTGLGESTFWFESGLVMQTSKTKNFIAQGVSRHYYKDGTLKSLCFSEGHDYFQKDFDKNTQLVKITVKKGHKTTVVYDRDQQIDRRDEFEDPLD